MLEMVSKCKQRMCAGFKIRMGKHKFSYITKLNWM